MQRSFWAGQIVRLRVGLRWLATLLAIAIGLASVASTVSAPWSPSTETSSAPAAWPPFVRIVPQVNGDDVAVYAEGIGHAYHHLSATFGYDFDRLSTPFRCTSHTWSHTDLEYDTQDDLYGGVATAALSEICPVPEGCLCVATASPGDPTLETVIAYEFVTAGPAAALDLTLDMARLRFGTPPFTDAVTHTVVLAVPPKAPAPLPGGWWILEGGLYVVESDAPDGSLVAALIIRYDPGWLKWRGVRPEDLRLWRWDAADRLWVPLPSTVWTDPSQVSASIDALTAYALAAPPKHHTWLPLLTGSEDH